MKADNRNLPAVSALSVTACGGATSPGGGGKYALAVREVDDQDLYVRMLNHHAGHIQRRQDRKDARLRAMRRADDARDQQMRDLATVSMLSVLGAVLAVGLAL